MDSSTIVKLFVEESHSEEAKLAFDRADTIAASLVAYTEVQSTFARLRRTGIITRRIQLRQLALFEEAWPGFLALDVDENVIRLAGSLTDKHPLSAFDAIHLATAMALRDRTADAVDFATFDIQLRRGALSEGFVVV